MKRILMLSLLLLQAGCVPLPAGDAQILDAAPELKPAQTITVQAAAPNVTVQAAPAPQVTVQAAQAPNVTVQAAAPQPAPNVSVYPPDVTVEGAKTDWNVELERICGLLLGGWFYLRKFSADRKAGKAGADFQDLLAWGLQWAKGDGPARLESALEKVQQRFRAMNDGADMSTQQTMEAEHGLAALHAASAGLVVHDPSEELKQREAALKSELESVQARLVKPVVTLLLCALLLCSGCSHQAAQQANADIVSSATAAKQAYGNMVAMFVNLYVSSETARANDIDARDKASHDAPFAAKIAALQKTVKLADGTTVQTGDPVAMAAVLDQKAKLIANLEVQHQANLAQVQRAGVDLGNKLLANAIDIDHISALSQGLTAYYAMKTDLDATINASAAQVLAIAQQFMPAPKAAPVPAAKGKVTLTLQSPVTK